MSPSCSAPSSTPSLSAAAPWRPGIQPGRSLSRNCETTASYRRKRSSRGAERGIAVAGGAQRVDEALSLSWALRLQMGLEPEDGHLAPATVQEVRNYPLIW